MTNSEQQVELFRVLSGLSDRYLFKTQMKHLDTPVKIKKFQNFIECYNYLLSTNYSILKINIVIKHQIVIIDLERV